MASNANPTSKIANIFFFIIKKCLKSTTGKYDAPILAAVGRACTVTHFSTRGVGCSTSFSLSKLSDKLKFVGHLSLRCGFDHDKLIVDAGNALH